MQVQPDRLMFNWRKVDGTESYPRYETLLPEFVELLGIFLSLDQVVAAQPSVAWVELQYVNPIEIEPHDGVGHGQLASILDLLVKDPPRSTFLPWKIRSCKSDFASTGQTMSHEAVSI